MKKIFTSLMGLCLALSGMAQTLTFSHAGIAIKDGGIYVSKAENEIFSSVGITQFEPKIDLTSTVTGEVFVCVESLDENSDIALCAIDGSCVNTLKKNNYIAKKQGTFTANAVVDMQIHWKPSLNGGVLNGAVVSTRATVSAWVSGQEANKVSFTLVMTNDPEMTAVESASIEEGCVTVQGNALVYDFNEDVERTLTVFTLSGVKVMSASLAGMNGRVALDELSAGQYVYVIESATGKQSYKFLIK